MNQYFKLRKLMITSFLAITGLVLISSCNNKNTGNEIRIGLAEVNYKPDVGLDLVGNYRGDDYASSGIHDSLFAKALVAEDNRGEKVAVLSIDICMLPKNVVDFMREYIASNSNIRAENVMIMATHTHS
ncbi:MAG: neutral/alkaline non-lysosomal ceramidase N-terminal domain-containing protein, partial [Bacteroidia bacterium]|nr:neutral/alkaline non-lysosomal ceramidase N-terminal domain-containing protein [Bacteroidia bacterium]